MPNIKLKWKLLHFRTELTPDAHLAYITPFNSPSLVHSLKTLHVRRDAVLLAAVEGLGVEHDVGAVARLGADDAALAAQLHPGHRQDGPAHTGGGGVDDGGGGWRSSNT